MENPSSSCESPELQQQGHNPYGIVNYQDFLQSLETLRSMTSDQEGPTTGNSDKNNAASSSGSNSNGIVSTQNYQEEDAANDTNSNRIENQPTQWFSVNSASDDKNIWGKRFFFTGDALFRKSEQRLQSEEKRKLTDIIPIVTSGCETGATSVSNVHNHGHTDHQYLDLSAANKFAPSTSYDFVNQFNNGPHLDDHRNFRPTASENTEIENNGRYCGNQYDTMINGQNRNVQWNQNGIEFLAKAERKLDDFINRIETLVREWEGDRSNSHVEKLLCETDLFIKATFSKKGAKSIQNLIKKLKRSPHAFTVTQILSTRFLDIMNHQTATAVIQECFVYFGSEPNKILYEKAINHLYDLAMHKVGCRSLNEFCISSITGEQRSRLINSIADIAPILAADEYGNYVVQRVLKLNNKDVHVRILHSLRGHFTELAQSKYGSHIVERFMDLSKFAMIFVVDEIAHNTLTTPCELAQHPYGNYIIQKALRMTKEHDISLPLYFRLVESLKPHFQALNRKKGGKNVIDLTK